MSKYPSASLGILLCATAVLSGCGIGAVDHTPGGGGTSSLKGTVFGGQQPVVGATIQLYTVGSSGNGSKATPMLITPVYSVVGGGFDISNDYTCGQASNGDSIAGGSGLVYIVATDGDPGLNPAANNPQMVLMTALGPCSNLATTNFIEINEVTTVAAAWALAPFMTDATHVGASTTNNSGITNAFLDAGLLADPSTGVATMLPSNLTTETNKLYALANSIASCVNSAGGANCDPLFTAATPTPGTAPTDTLGAALNIVKNPGQNVTAVFQAASAFHPFPSAYTGPPNDWTMSLTITGGGLTNPTALAIDADSNVWVVGQYGPLSAFTAQGTPLSATGFAAENAIDKAQGVAIDSNGDVWISDYNAPFNPSGAAIKVHGANSGSVGTVVMNGSYAGFYTDIYYPFGISADTNGHVFLPGAGVGATELNSDGSIYAGYLGGTSIGAIPNSIAADAFGGYWIPTGNDSVFHVSSNGTAVETSCCETPYGVATDATHHVWIANLFGNSFSQVDNGGNPTLTGIGGGGLEFPIYVAVDAGQNVWFTNFIRSIAEVAGNAGTLTPGTPISPTTGTGKGTAGGYGLDANLDEPNTIVPDRSGNVWTSNQFADSVTMFFGLATPTITPVQPVPTAP